MILLRFLSIVASLTFHAFGRPESSSLYEKIPRSLVIWHGMGDSYGSPGMLEFISRIKKMHPGIFVHSIYIQEDLDADQKAGFFGHVTEQVLQVSEQLANISELQDGFDAIGFSQGGQFLRAYVEMCNSPPIYNLITFGSQHMGISDLPLCGPWDVTCHLARRAAQGGVYTEWAQKNLVQAQYFRDPARLERYLEVNDFLPLINNENRALANSTYAAHLASLHKLVLVLFAADKTVVPMETGWFGSYAPPDPAARDSEPKIVPMRQQPLYVEDWIGLRALDERGAVVLSTCKGEHMQVTDDCWQPLVSKYVGGLVEKVKNSQPTGHRDALVVQSI